MLKEKISSCRNCLRTVDDREVLYFGVGQTDITFGSPIQVLLTFNLHGDSVIAIIKA